MKDIIGPYHVNENLDSLIQFIDSKCGTLESLMLELPVDLREKKDRISNETYFYSLAKEYDSRGTKIVVGDRKRHLVKPSDSKRFLELEE